MTGNPRIFISYRRSDTKWAAGRLYDRMVAALGAENVFLDVTNIEPGRDFIQEIEDVVGSCDVLLALIGRDWLAGSSEKGTRRIDGTRDLIHVEVATALKRNIRVIPILIDGAILPEETDLPQDLAPLARRNARQVTFESFHSDIDSFIRVLERIIAGPAVKPQSVAQAIHEQHEQSSPAPIATALPFTVSLETFGGVATPLIRKGSSLPAEASETFSTAADNQTSVEIKLFAGERNKSAENTALGTFQLGQIAEAPKGVPQIRLKATIDPHLVLVVTAEDLTSGRKKVLDAVDLTQIQVPAFAESTQEPVAEISSDADTWLTLTKEEAKAGGKRRIDSPKGPLLVKIPPDVKSGSKIRLRGVGIEKDGKRGDLYINVTVTP